MKYGVLWRKTTKNIGDDMQSYAESLWYPQVDYMVDIEELDAFKSEDDEPVATIMSAWYMWHKWNWPPSKYLYPLWIGLHYNDIQRGRPRGMPSKWEYVDNGPGLEYLKAYEPIGCRDYYTQERLDELGIKNFYSGCITLTLPKRKIVKPEKEYMVVVGVSKAVENYIVDHFKDTDIEVKVIPPTRPEPSTDLSWEVRKAEVEEMLDLYQNARGVISFRLHCTLPTLALGTPVLFARQSFKSVRMDPYKDYLNTAQFDDILAGKFDEWLDNPAPNPETFKPVRDNLIKICTEFIEQTKKETRKASELVRTSYTEEEVKEWQRLTMKKTLHNYHLEHHIDLRERLQLIKDVEKLEKQLEKRDRTIEKKNEIIARREARIAEYRQYGTVGQVKRKAEIYNKVVNFFPIKILRKIKRLFKKK